MWKFYFRCIQSNTLHVLHGVAVFLAQACMLACAHAHTHTPYGKHYIQSASFICICKHPTLCSGACMHSLTVFVLAGPPQLTRRLRYFNTATADHHTATLPWLHLGSCKPQQLTTVEGSKSDLFLEPLSDQHYQKELPVP